MIPSADNAKADDGHMYGVPFEDISYEIVLYNKAIFEEYGLKTPQTVSELYFRCRNTCSYRYRAHFCRGKGWVAGSDDGGGIRLFGRSRVYRENCEWRGFFYR